MDATRWLTVNLRSRCGYGIRTYSEVYEVLCSVSRTISSYEERRLLASGVCRRRYGCSSQTFLERTADEKGQLATVLVNDVMCGVGV